MFIPATISLQISYCGQCFGFDNRDSYLSCMGTTGTYVEMQYWYEVSNLGHLENNIKT